MIYAFDHKHEIGDICSVAKCEHARRAPVLSGTQVFKDIPMLIVSNATAAEYLNQAVPDGWCIPPLNYGCDYFYEIQTD
jgi:hypothetical protein